MEFFYLLTNKVGFRLEWLVISMLMVVIYICYKRIKSVKYYRAKKNLNTASEQAFYRQLLAVIDTKKFGISCKVRLADVVMNIDQRDKQAFYKVAAKHLDFVIFRNSTSLIECAVELDDPSHLNADAIRRDSEKNFALSNGGIRLIRVKGRKNNKYKDSDFAPILDALAQNQASRKPKGSGLRSAKA